MKWHRFVAIYENNDGLSRIQKALTLKRQKDDSITIRQLDDGKEYRPMLKEIRSSSIFNVIIDANDPEKINSVLEQAKEIKLLGNYSNFVITYLVIMQNLHILLKSFKDKNLIKKIKENKIVNRN